MAVKRNGTYYLTYHRYARREQVLACYPNFAEFLKLKKNTIHPDVFKATGIAIIKPCLEKPCDGSSCSRSFCCWSSSATALLLGTCDAPVSLLPPRSRSDSSGVLTCPFPASHGRVDVRGSTVPRTVDFSDPDHCAVRKNLPRLLPWYGFFIAPRRRLGTGLLIFGSLYLVVMILRYVIRMSLYPHERWTGGCIPIFFHWVLSSFILVLGSYHWRTTQRPGKPGIGKRLLQGVGAIGALLCISAWATYQMGPSLLAHRLGFTDPSSPSAYRRGLGYSPRMAFLLLPTYITLNTPSTHRPSWYAFRSPRISRIPSLPAWLAGCGQSAVIRSSSRGRAADLVQGTSHKTRGLK